MGNTARQNAHLSRRSSSPSIARRRDDEKLARGPEHEHCARAGVHRHEGLGLPSGPSLYFRRRSVADLTAGSSTSRISRRTRTESNGNEVEPPTKPPIEKTVDLRRNHAAINTGAVRANQPRSGAARINPGAVRANQPRSGAARGGQ